MLGVRDLSGKTFVDAGSGSGLFSLAARRLGARVHSFDYDPHSVACTMELKRRYFDGDEHWIIEEGSVLDQRFLAGLGQFDVVYSWGVLHHTGAMWTALENVIPLVRKGGTLFIAIYNDQGTPSRRWTKVKRFYNRLPAKLRFLVTVPVFCQQCWRPILKATLRGRPLEPWRIRKQQRGMSLWWDLVDWVGGYPFEVARPEEIYRFYRDRGFTLRELTTSGGSMGCNEFVFTKP
jgi:2-polyprenyl-6-hydroxyphenyl methylase/3-demethylubiquinone-9 3-methyltransferase